MRLSLLAVLFFLVVANSLLLANDTLSTKHKTRRLCPFVGVDVHYGNVIKHRPDFDLFTFTPGFMADVKIGQMSMGTKVWQQAYRNPAYGLGFFYSNLRHHVVGNPVSVYGFYRFYLANGRKIAFSVLAGVGIGGGLTPFNGRTNPDNAFIGTPFNFYFQLGPQLYYNAGPRWQFNAGANLKHFSNGGWRQPNLGINIIMANLGVTYALAPNMPLPSQRFVLPKPQEQISVEVLFGAGTKHREGLNANYGIAAFRAEGLYRTGHRSRLGLGFDAMYDNTLGRLQNPNHMPPDADKQMAYAITASHDLMFGNFAIATQLGFYLKKDKIVNDNPGYYQRYMFKYRFFEHLLTYASLKVHTFQADYVEWGIGYRFGVSKRKSGIRSCGPSYQVAP